MKQLKRHVTPEMLEVMLLIGILIISGFIHGYNMLHYPYFENDEGSYFTRAWTFLSAGKLDYYTYWYDHTPVGPIFASLWLLLTGGLFTFGFALNSARIITLLFHIASTYLLFKVTRRLTNSLGATVITCLFFSLSPLAIYFQRRFLLDNIMIFFILLSIYLILYSQKRLSYFIFSGLSFGIGVLAKENAVFFGPALVWLVAREAHKHNKLFVIAKWIAVSGIIISFYPLYALLKGELFPVGYPLASPHEHVSLVGTLKMQASRGTGLPFWNYNSDFMSNFRYWLHTEPVIIILGFTTFILQGFLSIFSSRSRKVFFITAAIMLFFLSGKLVINFYVIALIPFLGMCIGLTVDQLTRWSLRIHPAVFGILNIIIAGSILFYYANHPDTQVALTHDDTKYQVEAIDWAKKNIDNRAFVVTDNYATLDLIESRFKDDPAFPDADWYWKLDFDSDIKNGKLNNDFRNIEYIMLTNQMFRDLSGFDKNKSLLRRALANSSLVALFSPDKKSQFKLPEYPRTHPNGDWIAVLKQNVPNDILRKTWRDYADTVVVDGRVGESRQVSSRDQGYAMLRAVIANDRETFDKLFTWTYSHMLLEDRNLYGTVYGSDKGQTETVLNKGTTTEADEHIALSLALAYKKWGEDIYQKEALNMIDDIWKYETVSIRGNRYIVAGDWAQNGSRYTVSTSALMPFAYRIFGELDSGHEWNELVNSSYDILEACTNAPLNTETSARIPPNWCMLGAENTITAAGSIDAHASDYSYDAPRTIMYISMDYLLNPNDRAKKYLENMQIWQKEWHEKNSIYSAYKHDGTVIEPNESMAQYAIMLAYFSITQPKTADQLYYTKIATAIVNDGSHMYWSEKTNIYDQHWLWLGSAFYTGLLKNQWYNN